MYEETLKKYDAIVAECPRFERKGKTVPYTSANGHMFSLLNKEGQLGIRFAKDVQEAYFDKYNTTILKSHGATMRGYILIPETLLNDSAQMIRLLNESYDYVMGLDPK